MSKARGIFKTRSAPLPYNLKQLSSCHSPFPRTPIRWGLVIQPQQPTREQTLEVQMKLRWVILPMTWKEPPANSKQGEGRDAPAEHGSMNTQDPAESAGSDARKTRAVLGLNNQSSSHPKHDSQFVWLCLLTSLHL